MRYTITARVEWHPEPLSIICDDYDDSKPGAFTYLFEGIRYYIPWHQIKALNIDLVEDEDENSKS
jgi:hypothetical protein